MNDLMKSYFKNRKQIVKVDGIKSDEMTTIAGIPQGTCLGPLLYILYTNDIMADIEKENVLMYADDTAALRVSKKVKHAIGKLQEDIGEIEKWFNTNGLEINSNKSELVIFISENSTEKEEAKASKIYINGQEISSVKEVRYLGVIIDKQLKWEKQIKNTIKKLRGLMPLIGKIRDKLSEEDKKMIYHTIIESRLQFGIECWGKASKSRLTAIQRTQNNMLRILYKRGRRENIDDLYDSLNVRDCYTLFLDKMAKVAWHILKDEKDSQVKLEKKKRETQVTTRLQERLNTRKWNTEWGRRSSEGIMAKMCNFLDKKIALVTSLENWCRFPKKEIRRVWKGTGRTELIDMFW